MKMLIQNYSTALATEALYLHRAMVESECDVVFWADKNISTFDMLDQTRPDTILTHFRFISHDMMKYLSGSNIELILNVTGADNQVINQIESEFKNKKIKTPLFFTNTHDIINPGVSGKTKIINLLPALDIFIPKQDLPSFEIDTAFITTEPTDLLKTLTDNEEVYHIIGIGSDNKEFDFNLDIPNLISVIDRYKKCTIVDDIIIAFSQLFFECTFRCPRTILKVPENQKPALDKVLATLFHIQDSEDISEAIKSQIKRKHNPFNRAARLLRHLKCDSEAAKVQSFGDKL